MKLEQVDQSPPFKQNRKHEVIVLNESLSLHTKKCVYGKGHLLSCCSVVIFRSGGIVIISVSYEELPDITFCLIHKIVTWL